MPAASLTLRHAHATSFVRPCARPCAMPHASAHPSLLLCGSSMQPGGTRSLQLPQLRPCCRGVTPGDGNAHHADGSTLPHAHRRRVAANAGAPWRSSTPQQQEVSKAPAAKAGQSPAKSGLGQLPWGRIAAATALMTGSTVGAGMLALPAATADAGFVPSAALLGGCWCVLTMEALLIAEVNLAVRERKKGQVPDENIITLRQMAELTLGWPGSALVTLTYLSLAYGLLIAYISKSGDALQQLTMGSVPAEACMVAATAAVGGLLCYGGSVAVDRVSNTLTATLLALFVGVVASAALGEGAEGMAGLMSGPVDWGATPGAVPIVFLALVYHDLIPVLCVYLGNQREHIAVTLVLGSLLPLAMFLAWDAVALASVSMLDGGSGGGAIGAGLEAAAGAVAAVDPLAVLVQAGGPLVATAVTAFSLLAIATSFIGAALGVSESLKTELPSLVSGGEGPLAWLTSTLRLGASGAQPPTKNSRMEQAQQQEQQGGSKPSACPPSSSSSAVSASVSASAATQDFDNEVDGGASVGGGLAVANRQLPVYFLTLGPPLLFAAGHPGSFYSVLNAVGAYGMTLLYGLLPPLMSYSLRASTRSQERGAGGLELAPGGTPLLAALLSFTATVGLSQALADYNNNSSDNSTITPPAIIATASSSTVVPSNTVPSTGLAPPPPPAARDAGIEIEQQGAGQAQQQEQQPAVLLQAQQHQVPPEGLPPLQL